MTKTLPIHFLTFTRSWQIDIFMKKLFFDLQKLCFVALTIFFFSCENPSEIGFDFNGDATATSVYSDTLGLDFATVLTDSNVNGKNNYLMAGMVSDPVFGQVNAVAYFQPSLYTYSDATSGKTIVDTFSVKANPIIDSVKLRIYNTGLIFGDTLSFTGFNVYRLKSPMNYSKNYNGTESLEYEGESLLKFRLNSRTFKNATYDSLRAIYLNLPTSIGQEILNLAASSGSSTEKFNNALKGFAIVPENGSKAVYTFLTGPLGNGGCALIPYWHYQGETTASNYAFDLNGPRHSYLDFDRSGKSFASLSKTKNSINSSSTSNLTYIQSGSGLNMKINFDKLKNLGSNIKVSKAILEMTLDPKSISPLFPKIYNFVLSEVGTNNQQARNASNALMYLTPLGSDLSGSVYKLNDTSNVVQVDVTNFLQRLTNKISTKNELLMMPAVTLAATGNGILANDNLRRAVFLKPKLRIYYTKY